MTPEQEIAIDYILNCEKFAADLEDATPTEREPHDVQS